MNLVSIYLSAAAVIIFFSLIAPPITFLRTGWNVRKKEIVENFSDAAITSYFQAFHPLAPESSKNPRERFDAYYWDHFGWNRFIIPLILFGCIAALLLSLSAFSALDLLESNVISTGHLPILGLSAFLGAVMWVLYDEITRWNSMDLCPTDVYWWTFRLIIAIPMGYALGAVVGSKENLEVPLVFLLGAFPTSDILGLARRIGAQKFGMTEHDDNQLSELQKLQGVDAKIAQRLSDERISTITQLAYCDPVRLTIRTGFTYSYIVDITCQALFWIYVTDSLDALRPFGLRSAYEVLDIELSLSDAAEKADAQATINDAAAGIKVTPVALGSVLRQVAFDPYTRFLYLSWSGVEAADLNDAQKELLAIEAPSNLGNLSAKAPSASAGQTIEKIIAAP